MKHRQLPNELKSEYGDLRRRKRDKGEEKLNKEISKYFQNFRKDMDIQSQEIQKATSKINSNITLRYIIIKVSKFKDKRILKAFRGKRHHI